MIDFLLRALEIVAGAGLGFASAIFTSKTALKSKKMEIDANTDANAINDLKTAQKATDKKVDVLIEAVYDLKATVQTALAAIDLLSGRVDKHNNTIERTYELEANDKAQEQHFVEVDRRLDHLEHLERHAQA